MKGLGNAQELKQQEALRKMRRKLVDFSPCRKIREGGSSTGDGHKGADNEVTGAQAIFTRGRAAFTGQTQAEEQKEAMGL